MKLLPLKCLGVHETETGVVTFGVLFPGIDPATRVTVKVLHYADQFLQSRDPQEFELTRSTCDGYDDYWSHTVNIKTTPRLHPKSRWGRDGRYIYRYCITPPGGKETDWISDPFGREFGVGSLSAFTLGYRPYEWGDAEDEWRTPYIRDLVFYELHLSEFAGDLPGATRQLPYLADLGVNCIEIMPVSNAGRNVDWGFLPTGYFGVDDRFGTRTQMHRFIESAHRQGIAVVLDSVYGHTGSAFPYQYLYDKLGIENPFMGPYGKSMWGCTTNFKQELTRNFFYTVNYFWLDRFHVDGFRYDCVQDYLDGPTGEGFANLVYSTHQLVKKQAEGHWKRFRDGGTINLIQCAEHLDDPPRILRETYSNCAWQNQTRDAAKDLSQSRDAHILQRFADQLQLKGYPSDVHGIEKTLLQYIENHDHSRFICLFGVKKTGNELFTEGDRSQWHRLRPYLIGLLTAKGIPLLWQGQEFCENYSLPEEGVGRPWHLRPVRWSYAYDEAGRGTLTLVRKLLRLRRDRVEIRRGDFVLSDGPHPHGVLIYSRTLGTARTIVALNFSTQPQKVTYTFPSAGGWTDELEGVVIDTDDVGKAELELPPNSGYVW